MELTREHAKKVLELVDHGLTEGMGKAEPGKMCVEAAVCFALGLPHNDNPPCVGSAVRRFKIRLNDSRWSSDQARAKGMRELAIAQLGSNEIDQKAFTAIVVRETIRVIVPIAMRAAAKKNPKHAAELERVAVLCETEPVEASAREARRVATAAAADYAAAAADAERDRILTIMANIGLAALKELKSPGCEWLDLCE